MKIILFYYRHDRSYAIYSHDVNDQLADILVNGLRTQGKEAYSVQQTGLHDGTPLTCERCKRIATAFVANMHSYGRAISQEAVVAQQADLLTTENQVIGVSERIEFLPEGEESRPKPPSKLRAIEQSAEAPLPVMPIPGELDLIEPLRESSAEVEMPKPKGFRRIGIFILVIVLCVVSLGLALLVRPVFPTVLSFFLPSSHTPTPSGIVPLLPSETPTLFPSPTQIPSQTLTSPPSQTPIPFIFITITPPTPTATVSTPTQEPSCMPAQSVTLDDVGKTLCVTGVILKLDERESGLLIVFGVARGTFYFVSYDYVWEVAKPGACVMASGVIQRIGNAPVIVLDNQSPLLPCAP